MNKKEFVPCYRTRDLQLLSILKYHLDEMGIPFFVTGEEFIFLENLAVTSLDAYAILYLLPDDVDEFTNLLEKGLG